MMMQWYSLRHHEWSTITQRHKINKCIARHMIPAGLGCQPLEPLSNCRMHFCTQVSWSKGLTRFRSTLLIQACYALSVLADCHSGLLTCSGLRIRCAIFPYKCQVSHCPIVIIGLCTCNTVRCMTAGTAVAGCYKGMLRGTHDEQHGQHI